MAGVTENGCAHNPLTIPALVRVWVHILGDPQSGQLRNTTATTIMEHPSIFNVAISMWSKCPPYFLFNKKKEEDSFLTIWSVLELYSHGFAPNVKCTRHTEATLRHYHLHEAYQVFQHTRGWGVGGGGWLVCVEWWGVEVSLLFSPSTVDRFWYQMLHQCEHHYSCSSKLQNINGKDAKSK